MNIEKIEKLIEVLRVLTMGDDENTRKLIRDEVLKELGIEK